MSFESLYRIISSVSHHRGDNPMKNFISKIAHSCSDFGHYFVSIQNANCLDCPDCRCEEGPSIEEAQQDYREMHRAQNRYMF